MRHSTGKQNPNTDNAQMALMPDNSPLAINRTAEPSPAGNESNGEFLGHISAFGSRKLAR